MRECASECVMESPLFDDVPGLLLLLLLSCPCVVVVLG